MSFYGSSYSYSQDLRVIDRQLEMAFGRKTSVYDENRRQNQLQAQQVELFMSSVGSYNTCKSGYTISNNKNTSSYWSSDGLC